MEKQNASPAMPATKSPAEAMEVTYTTLGKEITLNAKIVKNYLFKGDKAVTDAEVLQFIGLCKYQQLNPFLNEAYLVKYGENAQIVTSKEAFMKRAEGCEFYEGFQAGIIVKRGSEILYQNGEFMLDTDVLLGGWAKVFREDRAYPFESYVNLKDYDKNQSSWKSMKCTMIRKVALVHAMREAFPTQLGAMYTPEESHIEDVPYEDVNKREVEENANKAPLPSEEETEQPTNQPEPKKPAEAAKKASKQNEQSEAGVQMPDIFSEL